MVVTLEVQGDDARAQVNFGRHGMKGLALSVAKLMPVDQGGWLPAESRVAVFDNPGVSL